MGLKDPLDGDARKVDFLYSVLLEDTNMYSSIATAFDATRYKVWPCVSDFLTERACARQGQRLLEAGVGNGKNLEYAALLGFSTTGFDVCKEFVGIAQARCPSSRIFQHDLCAPFTADDIGGLYDVILCIAVLHHIQSETERRAALGRLVAALAPGGTLLLTVWSHETFDAPRARAFPVGDTWVPWKNQDGDVIMERFYHIYDRKGFEDLVGSTGCVDVAIAWERQNWVARIRRP